MLPSTARQTAERFGIAWHPEMMTDTSAQGAAYQRRLGEIYFAQGLKATGNIQDAVRYYHGGPNRKMWGPKTEAYARSVFARAGGM